MFNDFHESTRNVGVVGVLLGFLVLVGFCGLGMAVFSGINPGGEPISMADQIINQELVMAELGDEVRQKKERLEGLEKLRLTVQAVEEKKEHLKVEQELVAQQKVKVSEVEDDVEAAELNFEEYRDQYRRIERSLAKGEVIDLSETKGEGFEKCKILSISPLHLRVMRSAGPIGIPYQELPPDVQDRFQFGAEEAAEYQRRVAAADARKNQQLAAFREKQKTMKAGEALAEWKKRVTTMTLDIQKQYNLAAKLDGDAKIWDQKAMELDKKAKAARAAGRITSNPGHARQARNKASRLRGQANDARKSAQKLEDELSELQSLIKEKE